MSEKESAKPASRDRSVATRGSDVLAMVSSGGTSNDFASAMLVRSKGQLLTSTKNKILQEVTIHNLSFYVFAFLFLCNFIITL